MAISTKSLVTAFLLSALTACAHKLDSSFPLISPSNSVLLSPAELSEKTSQAETGNIGAMKTLQLHYGIAVGDQAKELYWLEKAGDAGDEESRQTALCIHARTQNSTMVENLEGKWGVKSICKARTGT